MTFEYQDATDPADYLSVPVRKDDGAIPAYDLIIQLAHPKWDREVLETMCGSFKIPHKQAETGPFISLDRAKRLASQLRIEETPRISSSLPFI